MCERICVKWINDNEYKQICIIATYIAMIFTTKSYPIFEAAEELGGLLNQYIHTRS